MQSSLVITERDVAIFLAKNPRSRPKKPTQRSKPKEISAALLDEFSPHSLLENLKDTRKGKKGRRIDLGWYKDHLLELFEKPDTTASVRLQVLDRLKDLLLLGAIQDEEFAKTVASLEKQAREAPKDPVDNMGRRGPKVEGSKLKVVG
jgi:hypothetical protein